MADSIDIAQQREAENLARCLANTIHRPVGVSASFCETCDAPIPEARRKALPGVMTCVHCQTIEEMKSAHFGKRQ